MQHIKELREARGLTQEKAAEITGINRRTWSDYEKGIEGKRGVGSQDLRRLAAVLGCSTDYLLGVSDLPADLVPVLSDLLALASFPDLLRQIRAAGTAAASWRDAAGSSGGHYITPETERIMNDETIYYKGCQAVAAETLEKVIDAYSARKALEAAVIRLSGREEDRQQSGKKRR